MNEKHYAKGSYPTMITPYREDGSVDLEAACRLVEWYWKNGCDGARYGTLTRKSASHWRKRCAKKLPLLPRMIKAVLP